MQFDLLWDLLRRDFLILFQTYIRGVYVFIFSTCCQDFELQVNGQFLKCYIVGFKYYIVGLHRFLAVSFTNVLYMYLCQTWFDLFSPTSSFLVLVDAALLQPLPFSSCAGSPVQPSQLQSLEELSTHWRVSLSFSPFGSLRGLFSHYSGRLHLYLTQMFRGTYIIPDVEMHACLREVSTCQRSNMKLFDSICIYMFFPQEHLVTLRVTIIVPN